MDEGPSIALKALHDKSLSAEEACPELSLQGDAHAHTLGRTEKRVLLADKFATEVGQVHCDDLARVGRSEAHAGLPGRVVLEDGHEERLTGEQSLAGAQERSHEAALLLRAVSEDGLHLDAFLHEHHCARLGHHGFHGV